MALETRFFKRVFLTLLVVVLSGCAGKSPKEPEATRVSPEEAGVHVQAGREAYDQGRKDAAVEAWQKAVALDPANSVVVNNLALLLKEQNRFTEAAELLGQGIRRSPSVAELHYNLAVISELYLLDLETALHHYNRYRELSVEDDESVAGWIADLERRLQ